jgi:hypothetical protein
VWLDLNAEIAINQSDGGPDVDPPDAMMAAIHSAFDSYPKERRSRLERSQLDHQTGSN